MRTRTTRGIIAAVATLGVLATALVAVNTASAEPLVDGNKLGTLVITKFATAPGQGATPDGTQQGSVPGNTIAGVTFEIRRVYFDSGSGAAPINLTTSAGWAQASALEALVGQNPVITATNPLPAGYSFGQNVRTGTTDATGVVAFNGATAAFTGIDGQGGLPLGLYYVRETVTPGNVVPAEPFLVTIPMTEPDGTDWQVAANNNYGPTGNYIVFAYPKNDVVAVTKTAVANQTTTLGQAITYTVTGDIPFEQTNPPATDPITAYVLQDRLDDRLSVDPTQVRLSLVDGGVATPIASSLYTATFVGQTLTVMFTDPQGLNYLTAAANGTSQVQMVFDATIMTLKTEGLAGNGIIANTATLFPDAGAWSSGVGAGSPEVKTYFGGVMLNKVDQNGAAVTAGPATFQIFANQADALARTNALVVTDSTGAAHGPDFQTTVNTAGASPTNQVGILGLWYNPVTTGGPTDCLLTGDVYDPVAGATTTMTQNGTQYWVVETVAPSGYELQPQPFPVCVVGNLDGQPNTIDDFNVVNIAHDAGFQLPFTGQVGRWVLGSIGLLIVAGAVTFYVMHTKRRAAQA